MKPLFQKFTILFIPVCLISILSGCQISEPERYYDNNVKSEIHGNLGIDNFKAGQYVAGPRMIKLNTDSLTVPVSRIFVYIDGKEFKELAVPPYQFMLETEKLQPGSHEMKFYIVAGGNGTYSAFDVAQLAYSIPFLYDPAQPGTPHIEKIEWQNNHPVIYWKENTDANFSGYILSCYNAITRKEYSYTISERGTTSFTDINTTPAYGIDVLRYRLSVTNGYMESEISDTTLSLGKVCSFPYPEDVVVNPFYDLIYTFDKVSSTITAASTEGVTQSKKNIFPDAYILTDGGYALSDDGTEIYGVGRTMLVNPTGKLYVYDARTLGLKRQFYTGKFRLSRIAASGNKVFLAGDSTLALMNSSDGSIIRSISLPVEGISRISISNDKSVLFVMGRYQFAAVEISGDEMTILKIMPAYSYSSLCAQGSGGLFIAENENTISSLDLRSLQTIGRNSLASQSVISGIALSGNDLYVSALSKTQNEAGSITRFSADNLARQEELPVLGKPMAVLVSRDGKNIFCYLSHSSGLSNWLMIPNTH